MDSIIINDFIIFNKLVEKLYKSNNLKSFESIMGKIKSKLIFYDSFCFFLVNPKTYDLVATYKYHLRNIPLDIYKAYFQNFNNEMKIYKSPIPIIYNFSDLKSSKLSSSSSLVINKCFYTISLQIFIKNALIGQILIHRTKNQKDFSNSELFILKMLQPHICSSLEKIISANNDSLCVLSNALIRQDKKIIVMNDRFNVFYQNELFNNYFTNTNSSESFTNKLKILLTQTPSNTDKSQPYFSSGKITIKNSPVFYQTEKLFDPNIFSKHFYITTIQDLSQGSLLVSLTDRELEIAKLIFKGMCTKSIASSLIISIDTVKTHIKKIFQKTQCKSRIEFVSKYLNTHIGF